MRPAALHVALLALLAVSGCASTSGTTTSTTSSTAATATTTTPPPPAPAPRGMIVTPSGLQYEDLVVGDGDLRNPRTRASWIAFRRWVAGFEGGRFRLLGTPERSWDWPHVELADAPLGFRSVEAMLEAARR